MSASSERIAGTRTTSDQPPSTGSSVHAGYRRATSRARARLAAVRWRIWSRTVSASGQQATAPRPGRRADGQERIGNDLERRKGRSAFGRRPADDHPSEFDLRQSERLRRTAQREREHVEVHDVSVGAARDVERIVGEHFVGDDAPIRASGRSRPAAAPHPA